MKILKTLSLTFLTILFLAACQKEKSIEDGGISAVGSWQFTESGKLYTGNVDSAVLSNAGVTKTLKIRGATANRAQKFSIVLSSATNFAPGAYLASLSQAEFRYFTQAKTIFQGDLLTGELIVTITSLANNKIEGTFSGQAKDSAGNIVQILLGKFTSSINLGSGTTVATGTLNATGTTCAPIQVSGTYTQGIALAGTNTVQVQVNVATAGTYSITTNTVNGVKFSASGSFTTTGVQNVILAGSGTPVDSAQFTYSVAFTSSTCDFQVRYLPGTPPPPPVGDYFPTTANSFWVYDYSDFQSQDTVMATVNSFAPVINGQTYTTFLEDLIPPTGSNDSFYYRKAGGNYFEALDLYKYFQIIDEPVVIEYTFLKDNVPAGTKYQSAPFSVKISGIPVTGYIENTIVDKAATADVGGLTYNDVIKVKTEFFLTLLAGFPAVSQGFQERWYAKGIGLIYLDSNGQTLSLKRSQVN